MNEDWDWVRLQKALAIEAERGYSDLVGKQYRFSEFLCLSLGKPPKLIPATERSRWQDLAQKFASYSNLSSSQRTHLVVSTRNFLHQQKKLVEDTANPPKPKTPHTSTVSVESTRDYYSRQDISLDQTLYKVVDIGRRSSYLERLGLYTVRDLLFYYPRDHLDYARQVQICHLEPGETVTIIGTVVSCTCFSSPKNKKLTIFQLVLRDPTGRIKLSNFFSGNRFAHRGWQESYKRKYPRDSIVAASGLVKQNKYGLTLDKPEIEVLDSAADSIESIKVGRILPVYALSEGVPADTVRKAIITVLPATKQIKDPLPVVIREQYDLIKLRDAIANVHFPDNRDILGHAQRRLVFDEFFYLQLGFLQRRRKLQKNQVSASFASEGELIQQFQKLLPFKLTNAQQRVVNEITQDLQSSNPMNRLVQGDVGAGKTVVAVFAILAAIQSGYQAALMAPTEVLAQQHYRKLVGWFNLLHLPVELLTGSTKTAKRREIHAQLQTGELPLLVGTHALIQDPVKFHRLGLVVIDEQHRFGVQQRATLLAKGESPHVLSMTATPIPRTLALTLHGDLDVSQIDELPPGRQPIETRCKAGKDRSKVYDVIRREVAQGRQAYIIFPLVEESEKLDVKAAVEEYQRLSEAIFPEFQIGLLHGRMSSVDKDAALTAFRDNETQIIVSTTVIEVGVDVPNATVMVIENAERFGLSQLHQLRGRIGRGQHKSFCFLMSSSKSNDAKQRLGVLEQSQDGFIISEMDMRFRGPGAVLGTRQSGLPDFALANLVEDQEVLTLARDAAEKIILADPDLINLPSLRQELEIRYQKLLGGNILN